MSDRLRLTLGSSGPSRLILSSGPSLKMETNTNPPQYARAMVNTKEYWSHKTQYIPLRGEIIVYSDRNTIDGVDYAGIKIGDGLAYVVDLPFVGDDIAMQIMHDLTEHIDNVDIHVSLAEKEFWNNKLNYNIDGEKLILTRD